MSNSKIFLEYFQSESIQNLAFGVMVVNKSTVEVIRAFVIQNAMPIDNDQYEGVRSSILNDGYLTAYPVCLDGQDRLLDGNTRILACCSLVESGLTESIQVPFYTADQAPVLFNSASRGTQPSDIAHLFRSERLSGINCGGSKRRVEQCVEAVKMLRMKEGMNFSAYDSFSMQSCISSVMRKIDKFIEASNACALVCHRLGIEPDSVKSAHWVAMFVKHGVDNRTMNIAKTLVIPNAGTTQEYRLARFKKLDNLAAEMWGI